jgi:DNA-binding NtrC family response regulator
VIHIEVPPLRKRRDDIVPLAEFSGAMPQKVSQKKDALP